MGEEDQDVIWIDAFIRSYVKQRTSPDPIIYYLDRR